MKVFLVHLFFFVERIFEENPCSASKIRGAAGPAGRYKPRIDSKNWGFDLGFFFVQLLKGPKNKRKSPQTTLKWSSFDASKTLAQVDRRYSWWLKTIAMIWRCLAILLSQCLLCPADYASLLQLQNLTNEDPFPFRRERRQRRPRRRGWHYPERHYYQAAPKTTTTTTTETLDTAATAFLQFKARNGGQSFVGCFVNLLVESPCLTNKGERNPVVTRMFFGDYQAIVHYYYAIFLIYSRLK